MLGNILKLILLLAVGAASLALLFTFGLVILLVIAISVPIAYVYMRFKYPEIFKNMDRFHRPNMGADNPYQNNGPRRRNDENIIEVEYERVDEK